MPLSKLGFRRLQIIDKCLRSNMYKYPNMEFLIKAIEKRLVLDVSIETIQKDIAYMKMPSPNGFDAPIYYDRARRGYAYSDPSYVLAGVPLTDHDYNTIIESVAIIQAIAGSRIGDKFTSAMEKVLSITLEEFPNSPKSYPILQTMNPQQSRGFEHFDIFYDACQNKKPVSVIHYSYTKRRFSSLTIHPFMIKEFENKWYVLGYSEKHDEIRTFGFDRIYSPIALKKPYRYTDRKIIDEKTQEYYGVYPIPNQAKQQIVIHANALATNYFEANPIHTSQRLEKNENGSSTIYFHLIPTLELSRLFLSYGRQVRTLEPQWLSSFINKL